MFAYRQRGFLSLYNLLCAVCATLLLPFFAALLPYLPGGLMLEADVRLLPYAVAVFFGMVWGSRRLGTETVDMHRLSPSEVIGISARQVIWVAVCIFTLMFAIKDRGISRLFLATYLVLLGGGLSLLHGRLPRLLAGWLFSEKDVTPTLLIARRDNCTVLDSWLHRRLHLGMLPVGLLCDGPPFPEAPGRVPYLGEIDRLVEVIRERQVTQVILLGWMDDGKAVEAMIQTCEAEGCRFLIHNDYGAQYARRFIPHEEGGHYFLAVQSEPLEDPVNRTLKRMLDVAVALPIVVGVLLPICGLVWLGQRWQAPGPLFFVMERAGWKRVPFRMFKFRTMYAGRHNVLTQASREDPRVYPFGRFLRRTSLDELPQFLNVLRGEMSVVGPRPHLPGHDTEFSLLSKTYRNRALVKPGITGLAQIKGFRGEITDAEKLHQRVYWDLYYARSWSLGRDVKIVLTTAWQMVFPPRSAY